MCGLIVFTINKQCGIILIVKKLVVFAAAIVALIAAADATAAYASEGGTVYPDDGELIKTLSLTDLKDYSVNGELYAFADGRSVKVFNGGDYRVREFESDVLSVDIADGQVYFYCADEKSYGFSDAALTEYAECEHSFPQKVNEILQGGFYYFTDEDKNFNVFDKSQKETKTFEGEYTNLKICNGKVFAVKANVLYSFTGAEEAETVLKYADFSATEKIALGDSAQSLKTFSEVKFVTVDEGAFMTAVDLEKLDGEFFIPSPSGTIRAQKDTTALLLAYSGNSAIISIDSASYILIKDKTHEKEVSFKSETPEGSAQMLDGMIYASPFVVSGTCVSADVMGKMVKIICKIELENVLGSAFYEVEYTEGEQTVRGYVAEGFLSEFKIEDNKKPNEVKDPAYSEETDTKTILIIFAVVLLVLAAIGYVSYITAGSRRKKHKKKREEPEKED